jgi:hypothetical protein
VAANANLCGFSINDQPINYTDFSFYLWRDPSWKSTIRLSYKYGKTDLSVVAAASSTEEYMLYHDQTEKKIDWERGSVFASYLQAAEAYTSGVAYPVTLRITSLR